MLFTAEEVLEITSGKLLAGTVPPRRTPGVRRVTTDSRGVRPGDLFVALIGERFNGHDFVEAAVRRGAVGAVVQEGFPVPGRWQAPRFRTGRSRRRTNPWIIGVVDPLTAYQQLAAHHRTRFEIPVVAVTGSNGKTTTKDMVACVLAERWPSLKTEGNLNNRIGVPKTVLRLSGRHKACVVEMGVDRRGQTTRLCDIARPTLGLITNIGPDHLEFFGTLDASADAKGELLDGLPQDGAAILNADDPYFPALASRARCPVVSFGLTEAAQVRAEQVVVDPRRGTTFRLRLPPEGRGPERSVPVVLRAYGTHNLANALAAAAVGYALGLSGSVIARGLARFRPAALRSQVVSAKGIRFINDCYNANPASTKAAVGLLRQLGGAGRTLAVLGDMRELGPDAGTWHRDVGRYAAEQGVSYLIACGVLGRELAVGAREAGMASDRVLETADAEGAARLLRPLLTEGDVVLIKASRGMRLERVLELLREEMRGGNSP